MLRRWVWGWDPLVSMPKKFFGRINLIVATCVDGCGVSLWGGVGRWEEGGDEHGETKPQDVPAT